MDAEQMSFDADDRFDVALCRMGFMLMSDPARALENTHAALRPDGRLAFAVGAPRKRTHGCRCSLTR